MRGFFFSRDIDDFNILESSFLKPIVQSVLWEPHPAIAIEAFGLLKIMFEEVNDDNLSAGPQYPMCSRQRIFRTLRMMQRLAE